MSEKKESGLSDLIEIGKFVGIKIPWAIFVAGIWVISIASVMFAIILFIRIFAGMLVGLSDGVPFNIFY